MIFLSVPFFEKEEAKGLGAKWHSVEKKWYIPENLDTNKFKKWLPVNANKRKAIEGKLLLVELVPSSCWFSNVRNHVSQETWNVVKQHTFRKAGYRCEICGGVGAKHPVECHEVWNYEDTKHIQALQGTIALCPECHEVKHIGLAEMNNRLPIAKQWLGQINGWSKAEVDKHVEGSFAIWKQRCGYDWSLDIDWLNRTFGLNVKAER